MHSSSQTGTKDDSIQNEQDSGNPDKSNLASSWGGSPTVIACIDKNLRYLSVSSSTEWLMGRAHGDFVDKKLSEFPLLPGDPALLVNAIERAFATKIEQREQIDDSEMKRTFYVTFVPQLSANDEVNEVLLLVDHSMRFQMSKALENCKVYPTLYKHSFRDFFEQSPLGIAIVTAEWKILAVNLALTKMLGYSREELLKMTVLEVTYPDDTPKSIDFMKQVAGQRDTFSAVEKRYICKDGHIMWGKVTATPIRNEGGDTPYHMTVIENIDARMQAAQDLETERLYMKYIMDSTFDSIYFKDLENRFVRANRGTLNKFGLKTPEEITGKTDFDFFPKEVAEVNTAEEKNILETGIPMLDSEGIEMWPDRPDTWVSSSKVPVRDQNDTLIGIFGISRDITDRKQKETEIRQLNLSLEKKVNERTKELLLKNKELEEFTYTVSHDLKAPLRGISGYSSLLLQEHAGQLDEEGKNFLSKLVYSAEQLSDLIDDLLTYSHLERREINYSNIAVAEVVSILLDQCENEIQQKKVIVHLDMEDFKIFSSYDLLIQIIQNYLDNALKFTAYRRTPEIWIEYKNHGATSLLPVRDNGIGFDNAYAEKIFEIFQRLNRADNYPGTGISLALVKKAAQMLGYRVWAEGALDEGATFYLEINNKLHL